MYQIGFPGLLFPITTTISVTTSATNEDGSVNRGAVISTALMGATTTSTENITINIHAEEEKKMSFAKTYVESMSDEELSSLLEKIEGIEQESPKVYQK